MINQVGTIYERPWGTYQTLAMAEGYQVKVITINPGGCLSLQRHFRRAEHWVVVSGTPSLTLGDSCRDYVVGESLYIPMEAVHRMENKQQNTAKIIEVQIGAYLGEDDIERLEDVYGR